MQRTSEDELPWAYWDGYSVLDVLVGRLIVEGILRDLAAAGIVLPQRAAA